MMDIERYEQLLKMLDDFEHSEIAAMIAERKNADNGKRYSLEEVIN
jgi:hypothetical protein